jgi:hypothetical protein
MGAVAALLGEVSRRAESGCYHLTGHAVSSIQLFASPRDGVGGSVHVIVLKTCEEIG